MFFRYNFPKLKENGQQKILIIILNLHIFHYHQQAHRKRALIIYSGIQRLRKLLSQGQDGAEFQMFCFFFIHLYLFLYFCSCSDKMNVKQVEMKQKLIYIQ